MYYLAHSKKHERDEFFNRIIFSTRSGAGDEGLWTRCDHVVRSVGRASGRADSCVDQSPSRQSPLWTELRDGDDVLVILSRGMRLHLA